MYRRPHKRVNLEQDLGDVPNVKKANQKDQLILGEKQPKGEDETLLESFVLGGDEEILENLTNPSFEVTSETDSVKTKKKVCVKSPVWIDEDDDNVQVHVSKKSGRLKYFDVETDKKITGEAYKQTLKSRFEKVAGDTPWAKLKWQKEEDDEDDSDTEASELVRSTGNYLDSSDSLPKGLIQMKKCTDANKESPTQGKIKSVEFHPSAQVVLTAGMDHRLNIFQVDGKENPKIQSIFLDKFPIHTAHFTRDGTEVIMGSKHKSFYCYDMMAGKMVNIPKIKGLEETNMKKFSISPDGRFIVFLGSHGKMHFISAKSKEWIDTVKMNGSVECIAFNSEGSKMYSHGDDGEVYIWDLNRRQCVHKFTDNGCIQGTSIGVSKNNRYLATGSYSGVVNIYDCNSCDTTTLPNPLKSVMNLTTPCTSTVFNPTTEILAIASDYAEKAVKLVHFPSLTVFSNFPERTDALRIPFTLDFSLNSGYFCLGNNRGEAQLYRVKHYSSY